MSKKILDFTGTKISDVKQVNPNFSTCKVRVLYTGKNRNMSIISKDAVQKALPSIIGVPIVGEFSLESKDFKGHGGAIDLDSYDFIHTTKPYGFVPQDAVFSWEEVRTKDGSIREYLTVDGCQLWTSRYPEAYSVVEQGKGQSMEIEVNDGAWNDAEEAYDIRDFTFSALCILGDDVEPAFEDANISTSFSLDSDVFKLEYSKMMKEFKESLLQKKEEDEKMLKELLEKYSVTMEELTAKGLNFNEISEDELEAKIVEVLDVEPKNVEPVEPQTNENVEPTTEPKNVEPTADEPVDEPQEPNATEPENVEPKATEETTESSVDVEALQSEITRLKDELTAKDVELNSLREFKLNVEKAEHTAKVEKLFSDFQLTEEDVQGIDIHTFSVEEIEEKCYAILGKKLASKKNFSLEGNSSIKVNIDNTENKEEEAPYGDLFEKYKNKK